MLLEVNISRDRAKTGLAPDELEPLVDAGDRLPPRVDPRPDGHGGARLADSTPRGAISLDCASCATDCARTVPANVVLAELSMGMSGDYRERRSRKGPTIVRVGSALFEGIDE